MPLGGGALRCASVGPFALPAPVFEAVAPEGIQRVGVDRDVDNCRFSAGQGGLDGGRDFVELFRPEARRSVQFRRFVKWWGGNVRSDIATVEEIPLVGFLGAPALVVHHQSYRVDAVVHCSGQFGDRHVKRPEFCF